MNGTLHSVWGNAKIMNDGYYRISTRKEGNNNKALHHLIYENFYGFEIPKGYVVHHKNGDKLDNCILNLQLMRHSEHSRLHNLNKNVSDKTRRKIGEKSKGKKHTKETLKKMSDALKGKNHPLYGKNHSQNSREKMCKSHNNSTGFFRVSKCDSNSCDQGFTWVYRYYDGKSRRTLSSISLCKLKEKVLAKGLEWFIIDEQLAMETRKWSN